MARFRPLRFEQFEQRLLLTTAVSPVIAGTPVAQVRLEVSDLAGQSISSVQAGEEFFLNAYVADVRSEPKGVFAAYLDLAFDADRVVRAGDVEFSSVYKNGLVNGGTASGLLDEVGGFSGSYRPIGSGDFLLFRAPFRAEAAGTVSFLAEPASLPGSEVLLYGATGPLASNEIRFGSISLNVLSPRNSSQQDVLTLAARSFEIGNSDPFALLRDRGRPDVVLVSLPGSLLTGNDHDLLYRSTTSVLDQRDLAVILRPNRGSDAPPLLDLLNERLVLSDEFDFAARSPSVAPEWRDGGLFLELSPRLSAGRSFSMLAGSGFLFDDYGRRAASGSRAEDRVGGPTGWSPLFHDHQWLTAGLLRIDWPTQRGRTTDADLAHDGEMFDLGQIAYETTKSTTRRRSAFPRIDRAYDDEEWVASLDRAYSEETEIEGLQGARIAMEVDRSNGTPGGQEAASRPHSDEAAPTDSRSTGTEENPDRAVKDDHTPAA
jgi:hypothetical protein